MKFLFKPLALRFYAWTHSDEIIHANQYVQQKKLQVERNTGARRDYPMREAGGAMEVLMRLGLYLAGKSE